MLISAERINKKKKSSPNDSKLKDTLIYIVEDFFEENKNIQTRIDVYIL